MPTIHPTSTVEAGAELAGDVIVGPYCHVGPNVRIGAGTRLLSHISISGRTSLGRGNTIYPQAVLGGLPQDLKYRGEDSELVIGDGNVIRELVSMHLGTANGGGMTRVGDHNLIMAGAHIAHDCLLGNHIILANAVQLAGHVAVQDRANIGGAVAVHHYVTFGRYCFVGGMSRIVQDVPPYMICAGNPARVRGVNVVGLERAGIDAGEIASLRQAYRLLFGPDAAAAGPLAQRVARVAARFAADARVAELTEFLLASGRGLYGRQREIERRDPRHRRTTAH